MIYYFICNLSLYQFYFICNLCLYQFYFICNLSLYQFYFICNLSLYQFYFICNLSIIIDTLKKTHVIAGTCPVNMEIGLWCLVPLSTIISK
jgi:hypothetical protein